MHVVHAWIFSVNSEVVRPRLGSSNFTGIYYKIYGRIQLELTALNNVKSDKQGIRNYAEEVVVA